MLTQKLTLAEERTHRLFSKASKSSSFAFPLPVQYYRLKRSLFKKQEATKNRKLELERRRRSAGALSVDDISSDVIIHQEATLISRKLSAVDIWSWRLQNDVARWLVKAVKESAGSLHPDARGSDVVEEISSRKLQCNQQMLFGNSDSKTMSFT
ncbi:ABC transporter A family member 2 [Dorcoceras hygrometricum]|uniref:ABC transporter A family member 2 n=1 Tax=Dorcoceras hygrometricum TaxID=472368 RepID=A0A2Z7BU29_9LAMI|nr:ABC transporter A family member 2 [Dorcoceras hygrometricum]